MTAEATTRAGTVMSRRFTDADAFAHAIRNADIDYVPLAAGPYEARLTAVDLGAIVIQRAVDRAHVARGTMAPDRAALLVPVGPTRAPDVNGHTLDAADVLLLAPGSELHSLCRAEQDWAALSFPAEALEQVTESWRLPPFANRVHRLPRVTAHDGIRLAGALAAATDLGESLPDVLLNPGVAQALRSGLHGLLSATLRAAVDPSAAAASPARMARDVIRLVGQAEEFLRANVARPIYTDELCAALVVSPRKLHQAFVAACGMSPQAYLKLRRLMLVRRALRSGGDDARLVKSAALSHGFWHLGNFAHDYRAYFGETPSQTLAAVRFGR